MSDAPLAPLARLERAVGRAIPAPPWLLSLLKLAVVPLIALGLKDIDVLPVGPLLTTALFLLFVALDALDGIVARARAAGLVTRFGRVLDRLTDYPLELVVGIAAFGVLPRELVIAKLALEALVIVLALVKGRAADDRIRSTVRGDATILATIFLVQGFLHPFVSVEFVTALWWINIVFSAVVGLYNAGVLQKRFIADALSASNALCGLFSISFAMKHKPEVCLLLLLVGAGFDGLDGAAARRWGGTRFGVFSDDIADAINYAIAPGVALAFSLSGTEGTVVGLAFSILTISRLVFFTLNKSNSDPNFFSGVPSTIGGILVLCALILFPERHAIVGLLVGAAVVLMVSFDAAYRHLGRAIFGAPRERVVLALVFAMVLIIGGFIVGPRAPVAVVLALCLVYGFMPQVLRFRSLLQRPAPQPQQKEP